jgi:type II secretory pathway component GspD/PulD (secretin)
MRKKIKNLKILFILFYSLSLPLLFSYSLTFAFAEEASSKQNLISLDLKAVDINEVFRMLSEKTGLTIVTSKQVRGRVSLLLNNVSFQDALDIILAKQDLAAVKKDNVVKIMTEAEYEQLYGHRYSQIKQFQTLRLNYAKPSAIVRIISELKSDIGKIIADDASGSILLIESPQKIEQLAKIIEQLDKPLETAIFDLNYSKIDDFKGYLSNLITPGVGTVIVDERSRKIFVSDLPERINKIKMLVRAFDEEERQVLIDVEILQVTLNDRYQRGIDWEKVFSEKHFDDLDFVGNFPLTLSKYQRVSVGKFARDNYKVILDLLKTYGDIKILSRPQIVAVNNQEASVLVGSRQAYVTQNQSLSQGTTVTSETVEFIDVGVKLKVQPSIGKDGFITMRIKPEVSTVGDTLTTPSGGTIPIVDTSEAETVVKVRDDTTIMLGGMIKDEDRDTRYSVRGLSQLPILGFLFGNSDKQLKKTETIVFLTPHLISGDTVRNVHVVNRSKEAKKF